MSQGIFGTSVRLAAVLFVGMAGLGAAPMPGFASLSRDKAFVREGPSYQYPVRWIYRRKDLPVLIVQSYDVWRKIRDNTGTTGWIHSSMLSDRRTVLVTSPKPAKIRNKSGAVVALAQPGVVARVEACEADACEVSAGGSEGWIAKQDVWGEWALVRSSDDGVGGHTDPAGEPSGNPASVAAVQAGGLADWVKAPPGNSATGGTIASPLGQKSWALYHGARDPYILLITIYLFSPYFANVVVGDGVRGQALAGEIQAASGLIIAVLAPFLGAIADSGGRRKPWIALYTLILAAAMLPMWFAMPHAVGWNLFFIAALMAISNVAYEFSAVFHNSLLPSIASPRGVAGLSGLGYALGNAAGVALLLIMLICFALPGLVPWSFIPAHPLFGISHALHEPERLAGPACAIWLLIFCLPVFLFTPDRPSSKLGLYRAMVSGVHSVIHTTRSLKHYRNVGMYLLARLFFNDGMTAVLAFGGIYASSTFHWGAMPMIVYGIELSIFAMIGGFLGGWLGDFFGARRAIFISIGGTLVAGLLALTIAPDRIFWFIRYDAAAPPINGLPFFNTWPQVIYLVIVNFLAVLIVAGYANSRTMLARIAPPEKISEFFGLYSLSGQSTSFLATGFVGWLTVVSQNQRIGLLGETLFLAIGLVLMIFVREEQAKAI